MPQYISQQEERRGTRTVFFGGAIVAFLAIVGVLVWVFLPPFHESGRLTEATGSVQLHDIPDKLSGTLPSYRGDQYFVVPHQFVIVEKKTRRIVAIVPA